MFERVRIRVNYSKSSKAGHFAFRLSFIVV